MASGFFFGGIGIGIGHSQQVAEPDLHLALPSFIFILQDVNYDINNEFTEFIVHVTIWHQVFFQWNWHWHQHWHQPQPPGCRS
jgi:hypothetical protein